MSAEGSIKHNCSGFAHHLRLKANQKMSAEGHNLHICLWSTYECCWISLELLLCIMDICCFKTCKENERRKRFLKK